VALDDLCALDHHSGSGFPSEYPTEWCRSFFAPADDLAGALTDLIMSARISVAVALPAEPDELLLALIADRRNAVACVTVGRFEHAADLCTVVVDGQDVALADEDQLLVVRDSGLGALYTARLSVLPPTVRLESI
jgi:sulfopyruvate decarboxylase TPP-binding subunit